MGEYKDILKEKGEEQDSGNIKPEFREMMALSRRLRESRKSSKSRLAAYWKGTVKELRDLLKKL